MDVPNLTLAFLYFGLTKDSHMIAYKISWWLSWIRMSLSLAFIQKEELRISC